MCATIITAAAAWNRRSPRAQWVLLDARRARGVVAECGRAV